MLFLPAGIPTRAYPMRDRDANQYATATERKHKLYVSEGDGKGAVNWEGADTDCH
jgi:hypothetical protein